MIPIVQGSMVMALDIERDHLRRAEAYTDTARASLDEIETKIALLKSLSPFEFADRFLRSKAAVYQFMNLKYNQFEKFRGTSFEQIPSVKDALDNI